MSDWIEAIEHEGAWTIDDAAFGIHAIGETKDEAWKNFLLDFCDTASSLIWHQEAELTPDAIALRQRMLQRLRQCFEPQAHPPLAELAGAIAAATINVLQHQLGPLAVNAHELVQGITAHLAPLYAELERLKAENEHLHAVIDKMAKESAENVSLKASLKVADYANGILRDENARKDELLRDIEHQVGNSTPEPYRSCITKKVRDRIDREIGGSDGT